MKVIIAGSRNFNDYNFLKKEMDYYQKISNHIHKIISGTAKGTDTLGEKWAIEKNIDVERFPADWEKYGKSAGFKRNYEMAKNADALVVFWDGNSKGTKHMIDHATKVGLHIYVVRIDHLFK
jgi:hypothetical protein